ncbi:adenosylcobinamide-GDP ribazoletransferase [Pseudodesulfovibrio nedwellii]|uniref:Adenosylcobinamide-GDP ribazoletransferase n=1 Tax=Pseudodesulfovibrio nedwellii TaxID=2973072 RepID=A0ABM8B127_9BACT|nr:MULTISPECIES: adenosylcobinamide-GDP ribazoletransferase [Pseudodesulfovibrio]BDQ37507.1 adenosylcobinamide-GDP ribazoletransferase [Pseudodesulfovibrio nedwellii]
MIFRTFLDTLGFLTRLAPARVIPEAAMNQCMKYMVPVGLLLGAVVVMPFGLGLFDNAPWIQAWLMVLLSIFITRGLHFDGLSDVCDAVTTHTNPVRFWEVIKDSRSGAFGIIGLIMVIVGQVILFHEMATVEAYGAILWTFVLGRAASVWLGYHVRHLTRPGLGKLYIDGATLGTALLSAGIAFIAGVFLAGIAATVAGTIIVSLMLIPIYRLAVKVGGANGDFLGCAVMVGEVAAGLGFVLVM